MDKLKKNKQFEKFVYLRSITLTKKVERKFIKVQKDPNLANLKENDPKLFDYISTDKKRYPVYSRQCQKDRQPILVNKDQLNAKNYSYYLEVNNNTTLPKKSYYVCDNSYAISRLFSRQTSARIMFAMLYKTPSNVMSKSNMNNHKTYLKCMGMDYDDDDTTNIKYIKQSEKVY